MIERAKHAFGSAAAGREEARDDARRAKAGFESGTFEYRAECVTAAQVYGIQGGPLETIINCIDIYKL